MTSRKKSKPETVTNNLRTENLWRKPITLEAAENDDPLATLYQGREVGSQKTDIVATKPIPTEKKLTESSKKRLRTEKPISKEISIADDSVDNAQEAKVENENNSSYLTNLPATRVSESDLKDILKIKSETFHFTDIREILRGKSLDIYGYLCFLSGDSGVCKIKHLDLMKKLDISRPTLFKQGEWLTRLSLIEKRNVPGDHLGTSYIIHRLEDALPISESLVLQFKSYIENLRQTES